ncbi:hypothetical protein QCA50_001257 [Cerrena zonata]|uniref:Transcription elongation factor Eaf N-terminal domain-containing protein n=1 Tax=Cerrena zonata TaxID=2478898 RepID=A0AAW0GWG0_9APHY
MASTSSSTSWLPMTGRYSVSVGTSLTRSLKARKAGASARPSKLPEKDFFSFRYNFKPSSVDSTRPGVVEVKKGQDITKVTVERPNTHTFTLEKLDSIVTLNNYSKNPPGRGSRLSPPGSSSHTSTTAPTTQPLASASAFTNKSRKPSQQQPTVDTALEDELEMLLGDKDADGEPDPEALLDDLIRATNHKGKETAKSQGKYAPASKSSAQDTRHTRREDEEESEAEKPLALTTSAKLPQPRKPPLLTAQSMKASTSGKNTPAHASLPPKPQASAPLAPPPTRAPAKSAKATGTKRERPPPAQEDLPKPTPPKRQKAAAAPPKKPPPPKENFVLELPGSTTMPVLPPALMSAPVPAPAPAPEPQPILATLDDSEEEEWDDVMEPVSIPLAEPTRSPPARVIVLEEIDPTTSTPPRQFEEPSDPIGEEDDFAAALEKDLQEQLFDDDMEEEAPPVESQPIGDDDLFGDDGDEDDYSSSEDSDDD